MHNQTKEEIYEKALKFHAKVAGWQPERATANEHVWLHAKAVLFANVNGVIVYRFAVDQRGRVRFRELSDEERSTVGDESYGAWVAALQGADDSTGPTKYRVGDRFTLKADPNEPDCGETRVFVRHVTSGPGEGGDAIVLGPDGMTVDAAWCDEWRKGAIVTALPAAS